MQNTESQKHTGEPALAQFTVSELKAQQYACSVLVVSEVIDFGAGPEGTKSAARKLAAILGEEIEHRACGPNKKEP